MVVEPSTQPASALSLSPDLRSSRGAAFLLAVYLSALMLLLLGGVSLQRTTTEVKASEMSRSLQQAFWGAEAGLDRALVHLQQNQPIVKQTDEQLAEVLGDADYVKFAKSASTTLADGIYGPFTGPNGTYAFKLQTAKIEILSPKTMQLTRTVTATGTTGGRQASVAATVVSEPIPLSGIFANGPITTSNVVITGSIHTNTGTPGSIFFYGSDARVFGDVTIGTPDPANPYTKLYGSPRWMDAWDGYVSDPDGDGTGTVSDWDGYHKALMGKAGVVIAGAGYAGWTPKRTVSGTLAAVDLPTIQPIPMPAALASVTAKPLVVPKDQQQLIIDGAPCDLSGPLPCDLSNANGPGLPDGKILLKLDHLALGRESELIFNAPAELYLNGRMVGTDSNLGNSYYGLPKSDSAIYLGTDSVLVSLNPEGHTIPDGVSLLVTKAAPGHKAGAIIADMPWAFFGSVWAPESPASLSASFAFERYNAWMDLDEHMKDPGTTGGLKGMKNPYIVVEKLQLGPSGSAGCSAFIVDQAKQSDKNVSYTVTGWHNTQDRVLP